MWGRSEVACRLLNFQTRVSTYKSLLPLCQKVLASLHTVPVCSKSGLTSGCMVIGTSTKSCMKSRSGESVSKLDPSISLAVLDEKLAFTTSLGDDNSSFNTGPEYCTVHLCARTPDVQAKGGRQGDQSFDVDQSLGRRGSRYS